METAQRRERPTAVVIKALLHKDRGREDPFSEIHELAWTAGVDVVATVQQNLERPHIATYLGRGKAGEASATAKELDADIILADNDLSPAQERNLERLCDRTVIDRSQLIMDIFARRAKTHEAKLQVELAQLRYTYPRLKRLWTHLSRYEGGIGMRGPGETQLETDKRLVSRRIQQLSRELKEIERKKQGSIRSREGEFVIALVGYTNAGKSTLLNALTGSEELVEDKLFATLDTRIRRWPLGHHRHVLVTDTVGFIRDLPHHLIASFRATLAETRDADLLFHVVDASSPDAPWQVHTVRQVLRDLECQDKPTWMILNKWDAVAPEQTIDARSLAFEPVLPHRPGEESAARHGSGDALPRSFAISARSGAGIEELRSAVLSLLQDRDESIELRLPHDRGEVLSYIETNGEVTRREFGEDAVHVAFRMSPARAARLRRLYPEGFPAAARASGGDPADDGDGLGASGPGARG